MAESDGEIEYLDEDAEIVQQCVRSLPNTDSVSTTMPEYFQAKPTLMVERPVSNNKRKKKDEDSEYEPSDDPPPSPPSPPPAKKKAVRPSKQLRHYFPASSSTVSYLKINKYPHLNQQSVQEQFLRRKSLNIHIPDYDDPLCLPVRAIKAEEGDRKRLTNWNNVCLEQFKHCDTLLKHEQGRITHSVRLAVFKNAVNKQTGQTETSIWSKVSVENEDTDKKSEIFQCVLPRYREKKGLPSFSLLAHKPQPAKKTITEVILSKENHKDGEALVVYKPQESISAVYALIDKRKKCEGKEGNNPSPDEESKLFLKELTAVRMCAVCYQASWRELNKIKSKCVVCPVCGRACVSAHNLLTHFKTHSAREVGRYRRIISALLADMVGYHYRCRVCRRRLDSIRALRAHVRNHQGKEKFTCSVCNRLVNGRL